MTDTYKIYRKRDRFVFNGREYETFLQARRAMTVFKARLLEAKNGVVIRRLSLESYGVEK